MKKRLIILFISLVCLIIIGGLLKQMSTIPVYKYGSSNTEFEFYCYPTKGRTIEMMEFAKLEFDSNNNVSTVICRKFRKNYLKVWNLYYYWKSPYYQYPVCE